VPRNPDIPKADHQYLRYHDADDELIKVGSKRWFEWLTLEDTRSFAFEGYQGYFTARKENKQRGSEYWYAYRWLNGKTIKAYLGTSNKLTKDKLNEVAIRLSSRELTLSLAEGG
jgi:LuxR family maltose regulon positive regulatory protein